MVSGKFYDAVLALASALHLMLLDGYDVRGEKLGFHFNKGPVTPWKDGEQLMKYIKKAGRPVNFCLCFCFFVYFFQFAASLLVFLFFLLYWSTLKLAIQLKQTRGNN